jgi:hypothetical protein
MGTTPVLDVMDLLCLLVSVAVIFALSLGFHTTDKFKPAPQAFFAYTLSIWVLYVYGLYESVTARQGSL